MNLDELTTDDRFTLATETAGLGVELNPREVRVLSTDTAHGDGELTGPYRRTRVVVRETDGHGRYVLTQYEREDGYGAVRVADFRVPNSTDHGVAVEPSEVAA